MLEPADEAKTSQPKLNSKRPSSSSFRKARGSGATLHPDTEKSTSATQKATFYAVYAESFSHSAVSTQITARTKHYAESFSHSAVSTQVTAWTKHSTNRGVSSG